MKKYLINTYGCQMNVHESEKIAGVLSSMGYIPTESSEDADIIVFNTCCIREGAETKIAGNIGAIKGLKKKNKDLIVAVMGCMTQQKSSADSLKQKFPWLDIVIGTFNADLFQEYLNKVLNSRKRLYELFDEETEIIENNKFLRTSGDNAWVNITYGCNNFCSYCIVPYVRGRERSRKSENIINECRELAKQGYKQITLLGQNVNSYGNDKDDEINFASLCKRICQLDGEFKVKFMSSHPKDFSDELIEVIKSEDKMSKVVHLPMQSGSDSVLSRMNRKYTREWYLGIVKKLREAIPNVILTSDFIVGFPDETEKEFLETYSLVETVRFNNIFAFMYSRRKGTVADKMEGHLPISIKRARVNKLLALQKQIIMQKTQESVGQVYDCLLKSVNNKVTATSDFGKNIDLGKLEDEINFNRYYKVKVDKCVNNRLYGTILR